MKTLYLLLVLFVIYSVEAGVVRSPKYRYGYNGYGRYGKTKKRTTTKTRKTYNRPTYTPRRQTTAYRPIPTSQQPVPTSQPIPTSQPVSPQPATNDGLPIFKSFEVAPVKVNELSGLNLSAEEDFVWGVGDSGDLVKFSLNIDNPNMSSEYSFKNNDLEGITIYRDSPNKDLLACREPSSVIKISKSSSKYKIDELFEVEEAKGYGNSGIEGITYYKNDIVYLGSQKGAKLWKYNIKTGQKVENAISLGNVNRNITEIADLHYDEIRDKLWLIDSEKFQIFILSPDGTEVLKTYNLLEKISKDDLGNPEALTVDHRNGAVWVGCDFSGTSKLYKLKFDNL